MGSVDNTTSKPCCPSTTSPVVTVDGVEDYELKGSWGIIDGLKTYVAGPADAKKGILVIYDIFGFFPQTLRGADLIASGVGEIEKGYRVFMPDFFEGEPADIAWYPPETEDQGKKLMQWFSTRSPEVVGVKRIPAWLKTPEVEGIEEWGIVGYCWGGKVVSLICSEAVETKPTGMQAMRNKFKVAVQCHPGLIDSSDALEITTPMLILASMEEPVQDVTVYEENLRGEKRVEWFKNMVHGWMSARGDLGNVVVKGEYERAYGIVGEWLGKFL